MHAQQRAYNVQLLCSILISFHFFTSSLLHVQSSRINSRLLPHMSPILLAKTLFPDHHVQRVVFVFVVGAVAEAWEQLCAERTHHPESVLVHHLAMPFHFWDASKRAKQLPESTPRLHNYTTNKLSSAGLQPVSHTE